MRVNLGAPPLPFEGVRLPSSPIAAYDPPVQPVAPPEPTPQAGYGDDYEAWTQPFEPGNDPSVSTPPFPPSFAFGGGPVVYRTQKKWDACDVYVDMPQTELADVFQGAIVSVYVHAISQSGAPTLVATGRWRFSVNDQDSSVDPVGFMPPRWVAAARSCAQIFQVSVGVWGIGGIDVPLGSFRVTVVASNEPIAPPPLLGVITTGAGTTPDPTTNFAFALIGGDPSDRNIQVPQPELVGLQAVNATSSPAYLQYFETIPVTGDVPIMAWPLGSKAGSGLSQFKLQWRSQTDTMFLGASSTPDTYTALSTGQAAVQAFVR